MASKEANVLELFMNEPTKHWHFTEIARTAAITRTAANRWLRKLEKEKVITHVKPKGKMPYFQGNW